MNLLTFPTFIKLRMRQAFSSECVAEKYFFYFSTKTYVVGTQKNRLNETVLLGIQNKCYKLWVRKFLQLYAKIFGLSKPVGCMLLLAPSIHLQAIS